ncbi:myosin-2 heavy chain-like [Tribolium madens]|uniref:myosin-2 heavy chain-like n=1 Tax=Tribolium madens TaxID=41895 RepID=UPI001CF7408F|nr:myosin-2 heavy chain-like [Tribolium madens]
MSKFNRENTASKLKGAGDGVRALTSKSSERVPVPSSRKFTATMVRDESVQLKLKKVLDEIEAKQGLKKAKTVAEITPTKITRRNRVKRQDSRASSMLHATPRPPLDDVKRPPSGRVDRERRIQLLVYHRMLLFVWRRSKMRLAMVSESLRRRQEQISNLEKQIDCLKNLTQSECHKRGEAIGDCQRLESVLKAIQLENNSLVAEKVELQKEINELRDKLQNVSTEKENLKNEINTKNVYLKRIEQELQKERILMMNLRDQNAGLISKVKAQDAEIEAQEQVTDKLNQTLKDLEHHIHECEEQKTAQSLDLKRLSEQYQFVVKKSDCLKQELSRVYSTKDKMKQKIADLEDNLAKISAQYERLLDENKGFREETESRKCWWRNARDFLAVSWAVLQNAAYIMLPAM